MAVQNLVSASISTETKDAILKSLAEVKGKLDFLLTLQADERNGLLKAGKELGQKLHGRFSITRIEDPETNIELGTYHLQHMIQLFGNNVQLAVASYNAGQGNVMKWRRGAATRPMDELLESIPFPETRNYVKRVTILRSSYARIAQ